jgi:hypothetical protein
MAGSPCAGKTEFSIFLLICQSQKL